MERITPDLADTKPHTWLHHVKRYEFACRYCHDKVVLDVGCGEAYGSEMLRTEGQARLVVALDINLDPGLAKKYPRLMLFQGDALNFPFKDESFDIVTAFEVIEHLNDPQKALGEIRRILKRGGIALISKPRRDLWHRTPTNPYHKFEFSFTEFKTCITSYFSVFRLFGQYFDYVFVEMVPPGLGLRRLLRYVGSFLAKLNRSEHLLHRYDVMPIEGAPRYIVPKYMIAVCRKI
jgi:ubiquinone/menaquinone biosynthesis C-methylase UbiE